MYVIIDRIVQDSETNVKWSHIVAHGNDTAWHPQAETLRNFGNGYNGRIAIFVCLLAMRRQRQRAGVVFSQPEYSPPLHGFRYH